MPSYSSYVSRHGEVGAQALLEQLAIRAKIDIWSKPQPLETLWNQLMQDNVPQSLAA